MRNEMLNEFIIYVKNNFKLNIKISSTKSPESFEEIFGMSYLKNNKKENK